MTKPADHQARIRALDTSRSFAVSAPAGSGKTGLLTQRILCLLAEVETPEQILCMTFTRKAAGEMRHRLMDALVNAQNDPAPEDPYELATWTLARRALAHDKAQNWQLIAAPNRLRILTIDSFCRNLASQLVLESGFGELPEPVDNADKFYRLAIQDLLGELESNSALGESLSTLLIHFDNDMARLEGLLLRLLSKREQWLPHILTSLRATDDSVKNDLELAAKNLIEETFTEATGHLVEQASNIALLADYAAQHLQSDAPESDLAQCLGLDDLPENTISVLPHWLGIAELFLTKSGDWRKTINKKAGFPTKKDSLHPDIADGQKKLWGELREWCQQQSGLLEVLNDIRYLPAANFGDQQWQVLEALTNTLPQLSARLNLIFRSEGACDYTEVTLAALTALGDEDSPTDLTLRLDNQIRHILVDEFQDTSTVHFDMLRRLTAGWQNNDGRTLFFVGDGMQSLYGFRNANVGLFIDIRQHPFGELQLEPLDLNVNFRSQANIIRWVNRLFSGAFPAIDNRGRGAVAYAASEPFKATTEGPAVHLDIFEEDLDRLLEAEQVAQIVLDTHTENPSSSVAILIRGRAHLREILPALRQHELSWQATDIDPLASCMPVIDLLSLTRAMINPADRIAWLAILRAPWCALSLGDLLQVATATVASNPIPGGEHYPLLLQQVFAYAEIEGLSDEGRQILSRVTTTLSTAWQQRFRKPLRIWLEGIWIDLGGPSALIDKQSLGQCRQYWDLLESYARDAGSLSDWSAFEPAVDKLYAEASPSSENKPEANSNKVKTPPIQIMTIHKAKGLEFDTVILPGLDRRTRGADSELLLWRERVAANGRTQLLLSPPQKLGGDKDQTYEHLKREESIKNRLENTRVLYVACTRAINKLHLLFKHPDKDFKKGPAANSLLAALWPTLKGELQDVGAESQLTYHAPDYHSPDYHSSDHDDETSQSDTEEELITDNSHRYQWRLPPDWKRVAYINKANTPTTQESQLSKFADDPFATDTYTGVEDVHHDPTENQIGDDVGGRLENKNSQIDPPDDARKTGILFHRTLQYLVSDGLEQWDKARLDRQHQLWLRQTKEFNIADPTHAIDTMTKALHNCLSDGANRWIFDNSLEDSQCELALGYMDHAGKARTVIVDRTFIIDGERWIVDYKLSDCELGDYELSEDGKSAADNSLDEFLIQQKRKHTSQLLHYANLFMKLAPPAGSEPKTIPIKTALYFPLLSHLELVST